MRIYKNLDTLKKTIFKKEKALKQERDRTTHAFTSLGWGAGMRRSKLGCSYAREDKLKMQLKQLYCQLEDLEH